MIRELYEQTLGRAVEHVYETAVLARDYVFGEGIFESDRQVADVYGNLHSEQVLDDGLRGADSLAVSMAKHNKPVKKMRATGNKKIVVDKNGKVHVKKKRNGSR